MVDAVPVASGVYMGENEDEMARRAAVRRAQ
jgi:hypothetical protein